MKKSAAKVLSLVALVASFVGIPLPAPADDAITPQSVTVTNWRDTASIEYSSDVIFVQGATMQWNMFLAGVAYSTNGYTAQGLSNVTVQVSIGNSTTSTLYTASIINASNGQARVSAPLPAMSKVYWQPRAVDANTNTYYYQQQMLHAEPAL